MIDKELQKKIQIYEQEYFSLDKPVPFKKNLYIYPVKVNCYYDFYSNVSCLTMDKNIKKVKEKNELGIEVEKEVSNPKGIGMSYMGYLIDCIKNTNYGSALSAQIMRIFELVFQIKSGFYCPNCGKEELHFDQILKDVSQFKGSKEEIDLQKTEYFVKNSICPICGNKRREIFSIKESKPIEKFCVYDQEFSPKEFDEFKSIVLHYNILDYDGDNYIDPLLKKDMEEKARLENRNYSGPSLEKQLVCVAISSSYTIEMLKDITLRKLSLMLKTIDAKNTYYTQLQGMYSGMVKFKEDPKHWIFSDNKKDMAKEIMTMNDVQEKFKNVT